MPRDAAALDCASRLLEAAARHVESGNLDEASRLVEAAHGALWFDAMCVRLRRERRIETFHPVHIFKEPRR